jgi:hypothetical protein
LDPPCQARKPVPAHGNQADLDPTANSSRIGSKPPTINLPLRQEHRHKRGKYRDNDKKMLDRRDEKKEQTSSENPQLEMPLSLLKDENKRPDYCCIGRRLLCWADSLA